MVLSLTGHSLPLSLAAALGSIVATVSARSRTTLARRTLPGHRSLARVFFLLAALVVAVLNVLNVPEDRGRCLLGRLMIACLKRCLQRRKLLLEQSSLFLRDPECFVDLAEFFFQAREFLEQARDLFGVHETIHHGQDLRCGS